MDYQLLARVRTGSVIEYFKNINIARKILVITSPSVEKIDAVKKSLNFLKKSKNINQLDICHISPEAPIDQLEYIVVENKKPDQIIAIGGGSVIDAAKVLSVSWQGATVSELYYKKVQISNHKIEVTAVPTTAGTGAELSHGAIIYDRKNSSKGGVRGAILQPDAVFIDPSLYLHAPQRLIAETGFDCLTHAIETYCSKASNSITRYQSVKAIEIVFGCLQKAVSGDLHSMEKMAIAAAFMGLNLAYSRTCLPHRIQYVIGPYTHTSHAQGLIMLYSGWLPLIKKTDAFQKLSLDLKISVEKLSKKINKLKQDLDIDYKLGDYGVQNKDVNELSEQVSGSVDLDPCYEGLESINLVIKNSI